MKRYSTLAGALFLGACSVSLPDADICAVACTDAVGNIYVSEQITSLKNTEPGVVLYVFEHEVAHNILDDPTEVEADLWAERIVLALGFDPCRMAPLLIRFNQVVRAQLLAERNSCP